MTDRDEVRFTDLFHRHRDAVHAYLVGRTRDRPLAADLLQETFLRLWNHLDAVASRDEDGQRAWLFTVARNLAVDHARSAAARPAVDADLTRVAAADGDDPSRRAVGTDRLDRLDRAIADLPEELRVVLTLSVVADMTSAQMGAALGLPAGTVRSRLHEARHRLRQQLDDREAP